MGPEAGRILARALADAANSYRRAPYKVNILFFPTRPVFPDRCTVKEKGRQCASPPEFVISVTVGSGEYMVGVTCGRHKRGVSEKIESLQQEGKIPDGKISFEPLKAVGTDCIKGSADDLIQIG